MDVLPAGVTSVAELRTHYAAIRNKHRPVPLRPRRVKRPEPALESATDPINLPKDLRVVYLTAPKSSSAPIGVVLEEVAKFYELGVNDLVSDHRCRYDTRARHIAMYLAKTFSLMSLTEIGRRMRRDHTSCLHGVKRIQQTLVGGDQRMRDEIDVLKLRIADRQINRAARVAVSFSF